MFGVYQKGNLECRYNFFISEAINLNDIVEIPVLYSSIFSICAGFIIVADVQRCMKPIKP